MCTARSTLSKEHTALRNVRRRDKGELWWNHLWQEHRPVRDELKLLQPQIQTECIVSVWTLQNNHTNILQNYWSCFYRSRSLSGYSKLPTDRKLVQYVKLQPRQLAKRHTKAYHEVCDTVKILTRIQKNHNLHIWRLNGLKKWFNQQKQACDSDFSFRDKHLNTSLKLMFQIFIHKSTEI